MCTWGLCVATARASSCQGKDGCARMIRSSGKSTATSSTSMGLEYFSRMPPPPGTPAPIPVCPVWNSAGTPSSSIASYSGYAIRSSGENAWMLGWNLKPRTPYSSTRRRASRTPARPLCGSTLANGTSTSAWAAQLSATSSLAMRGWPVPCSASTVNTTATMRRSR